jgi:hypothetical protein
MLYAKLELSSERTKDTPPRLPYVIEWRTHANSHNWSNLQIALHVPRNEPTWFAEMVFLNLHNEDHFLTIVSWKELIMLHVVF